MLVCNLCFEQDELKAESCSTTPETNIWATHLITWESAYLLQHYYIMKIAGHSFNQMGIYIPPLSLGYPANATFPSFFKTQGNIYQFPHIQELSCSARVLKESNLTQSTITLTMNSMSPWELNSFENKLSLLSIQVGFQFFLPMSNLHFQSDHQSPSQRI